MADTRINLWLDLEPSYIDSNFENILEYLRQCDINQCFDSFYTETLELIIKRIDTETDKISNERIYTHLETDKEKIRHRARLLLLYLVATKCEDKGQSKQVLLYLLCSLFPIVSRTAAPVLHEMIYTVFCSAGLSKLGVGWSDLINFNPDIVTHLIKNGMVLDPCDAEVKHYYGQGGIIVTDSKAYIFPCNNPKLIKLKRQWKEIACSYDDNFHIMADKSEKVKFGEGTDLSVISTFYDNYIKDAQEAGEEKYEAVLNKYTTEHNPSIDVVITSIQNGVIRVSSINEEYETIEGVLKYPMIDFYEDYIPSDLISAFSVNDVIRVHIDYNSTEENWIFTIEDTFLNFILDERAIENRTVAAVITKTPYTDNKGFLCAQAWTVDGFPVNIRGKFNGYEDALEQHSLVNVTVQNQNDNGYIYASIEDMDVAEEFISLPSVRKKCLQEFVKERNFKKVNIEECAEELSISTLSALAFSVFIRQHHSDNIYEKCQLMGIARVLYNLIGDTLSVAYLKAESDYLKSIVAYAQNKEMPLVEIKSEPEILALPHIQRECKTLTLLAELGRDIHSETVRSMIYDDDDPQINKLARLVQSYNTLGGMASDSSIIRSLIKKEITSKYLLLGEIGEITVEKVRGYHVGCSEDKRNEFKKSIVFPSGNGGKADPRAQMINVFKVICAFLNSELGGILYLGVDDDGYANNYLEDDFTHLKKKSMDEYIRHLSQLAIREFGRDIVDNFITIKDMSKESWKYVAIEVKPYEMDVVKLQDVVYVKENNSTREATQNEIMNLRARLANNTKELAKNIYRLKTAIDEKKIVTVHRYRSSNSNQESNRHLEPFKMGKYNLDVWCYDLDDVDPKRRNKLFTLNRMGDVQIMDENWKYGTPYHKAKAQDIFRMTGDKKYEISLSMKLRQMNFLMEYYHIDKNVFEQDTANDRYLLNTTVYNLTPVVGFCVQFGTDIEVYGSNDLKEAIKAYLEKLIDGLS